MLLSISRISFLSVCLVACSSVKRSTDTSGVRSALKSDAGGISGGGGYTGKYAEEMLVIESQGLATAIETLTDDTVGNLPGGWTRAKLAALIRSIRQRPLVELQRDERDLMFNYGIDGEGPYIEALKSFYLAYGAFSPEQLADYSMRRSLWVRLVHEAAHLFGFDEIRSEVFANELVKATEREIVHCRGTVPIGGSNSSNGPQVGLNVLINIISSRGITFPEVGNDIDTDVLLREGIPGETFLRGIKQVYPNHEMALNKSLQDGVVIYQDKYKNKTIINVDYKKGSSVSVFGEASLECHRQSYVMRY